jgi:hypothetical protein
VLRPTADAQSKSLLASLVACACPLPWAQSTKYACGFFNTYCLTNPELHHGLLRRTNRNRLRSLIAVTPVGLATIAVEARNSARCWRVKQPAHGATEDVLRLRWINLSVDHLGLHQVVNCMARTAPGLVQELYTAAPIAVGR